MTRRFVPVPVFVLLIAALLAPPARAQQVADTAFHPPVPRPAYELGQGPVLLIDEAHANYHTADGRYRPFAEFARRDGYQVRAHAEPFRAESLAGADVLVVANAIQEGAAWQVPIASAFTDDEIAAVVEWVRGGGGLLLLADHMPFPGAADALGRALGLRFVDGFAMMDDEVFRRSDGTLADHPITRGRDDSERVDSIRTFTGQAFVAAAPGPSPLLVLDSGAVSLQPDTAWVFHDDTPTLDAEGAWQGAAFPLGEGRVVVLGEAAMFSAQLAGEARNPMGMNHPAAAQNPQLLLNTLHWLSGLLPEGAPTVGPSAGSIVAVGGALRDPTIIGRFIELAGGPDAPIVVIPTAGGADAYDDDFGAAGQFRENGANDVRVLHTWDRAEADSEAFTAPLREAGGVWFSGGRQWRLADVYLGTRTEAELAGVLDRGGVVGGTSAGASILGSYLVRGDTETNTVMMGDHEEGLGLLRGVGIDQHLLRRNRQFDLFEVIDARPDLLGIGLDENTALVVQGDWGQVLGPGYVAIYDSARRHDRVPFYLLSDGDAIHLGTRLPYSPSQRGLWPIVLR